MRAVASPPVARIRSGRRVPAGTHAAAARSTHTVRDAVEADLPRLLVLWQEIRPAEPRRGARAPGRGELDAGRAAAELRFRAAMVDPDQRLLVVVPPEGERHEAAGNGHGNGHGDGHGDGHGNGHGNGHGDAHGDGPVVAMALLSVEWTGRRGEVRAATVSQYLVDAEHRRRGAGRALVAAAMVFAEAQGTDTVAVDVHPDHRETNRYFARMGFVPAVTRRVAPLSLLRRSLLPVDPAGTDVGAQRLRLRLRGPVDRAAVQARLASRRRA